jgi:hypothetical protein
MTQHSIELGANLENPLILDVEIFKSYFLQGAEKYLEANFQAAQNTYKKDEYVWT